MKLIKNNYKIMTSFTFNNKWLLFIFIKLRMAFNKVGRPINTHNRKGDRGIDIVCT
jgi:hypothetical protein